MGTSANRDKVKPGNPLLPDWIPALEIDLPQEEYVDADPNNHDATEDTTDTEVAVDNDATENIIIPSNRFLQSQRGFRNAVKTGGVDRGLLTRVVKNYISRGGGGPRVLSRRMTRSSGAIVRLGETLLQMQQGNQTLVLQRLQLDEYIGKPVFEVLSALMNKVCSVGAVLDDAITNQAYANAICRIEADMPGLNLDHLNEAQIAEMLAIFLEETIVSRLICDVGRSLTVATSDVEQARSIENNLYQIVNGLVHSQIVPHLQGALRDLTQLHERMDSIYQIAFTSIIQ